MKFRKLINGKSVEELDKAIGLIIYTKAPEKYKLIDLETGEEYLGCKNGNFTYHKMLMKKINDKNIGQWVKIKAKHGT
jgi:hypothetical protein